MYYGSEPGAEGWMLPLIPYHFTMLINLERDPFEQSMGAKSFNSFGGALTGHVLHLRLEHSADRPEAGPAAPGDL